MWKIVKSRTDRDAEFFPADGGTGVEAKVSPLFLHGWNVSLYL